MSFFKKLFNRVIGKKEEEAPPPPAELEALPAPEVEPVPEPEPVAEPEPPPAPEPEREPAPPEPEPVAIIEWEPEPVPAIAETVAVPEPVAEPEPKAKKASSRKPEPKKPEPKAKAKPEPKKPEPKRPAAKKAAQPKPEIEPPPEPVTPPVEEPPAPPPEPELPPSPEPEPITEPPAPEPEPQPETPPVAEVAVPEPEPQPEPSPPPPAPAPAVAEERAQRRGWFARLSEGLSKSSKSITGSITSIFTKRKLDKETLQDLEDVLLQADLGLPMAERIVKAVATGRYDKEIDPEEVKRILASEVSKVLKPVEVPFNFGAEKPFIILVVGVNGAGKTTTIGKLGAIARAEGFGVMFAACDTFRAAAIEQLTVWGGRIGAKVVSRPTGADASGLAFDAMKEAKENGTDILFIDTAGRLQNKQYLMDELDKIVRVIKKQDENAPHAVLLVLDATTGQNAMQQADIFTKVAGVTGIIMTKLDGTARGGILVAIAEKFKLPVHAIGVGEKIEDLQPFEAEGFARAIAGLEDR